MAKPIRKFHSEAQRQKCRDLVAAKQMTQAEFDRMESASAKHLPARKAAKP
jgi:hypothetical protein